MMFGNLRDGLREYKELPHLEQAEWSDEAAQRRREMPWSGAKGKAARFAFLVFAVALLSLTACYFAGIISSFLALLDVLRRIGIALLAFAVTASVVPSLQVTWSQIWGPRFPLAAVLSLAVSAALVAMVAWGCSHFIMLYEAVAWSWDNATVWALGVTIFLLLIPVLVVDALVMVPLNRRLRRIEVVQCHQSEGQ